MESIAALNWLAVLTATVAGFVLGGLWYGPLFGKAWMAALGKTPDDIKPSPAPFIVSFCTALITAIVMALMINALGITSAAGGLHLGLAIGLGFIATAMASDSAFCGWGVKLFAIQAGYRAAYSLLMGVILAVWQ
jgi:hypothetical protein